MNIVTDPLSLNSKWSGIKAAGLASVGKQRLIGCPLVKINTQISYFR